MTEEEARAWIEGRYGAAALGRLMEFERLFRAEAERQNLISPATMTSLWARHFVDSAQLLDLVNDRNETWVDVGTGAGFPGLIVAMLRDAPIRLIEPRSLRAKFLRDIALALGLEHIEVCEGKVEAMTGEAAVISARAVANVPSLLKMTAHLRTAETALLFPRGRSGVAELESLPRKWQRLFHVEQSVTDPASVILVSLGAR